MIQTLASLQRIRNSFLATKPRTPVIQNASLSVAGWQPVVSVGRRSRCLRSAPITACGHDRKPTSLRRRKKLDGDQLAELNISRTLTLNAQDCRGVMEEDHGSKLVRAAALTAAANAASAGPIFCICLTMLRTSTPGRRPFPNRRQRARSQPKRTSAPTTHHKNRLRCTRGRLHLNRTKAPAPTARRAPATHPAKAIRSRLARTAKRATDRAATGKRAMDRAATGRTRTLQARTRTSPLLNIPSATTRHNQRPAGQMGAPAAPMYQSSPSAVQRFASQAQQNGQYPRPPPAPSAYSQTPPGVRPSSVGIQPGPRSEPDATEGCPTLAT